MSSLAIQCATPSGYGATAEDPVFGAGYASRRDQAMRSAAVVSITAAVVQWTP